MLATDYPITVVCQVVDLPRSTQYYQPVVTDEGAIKQALEDVAQAFPTYGSRRLAQQVRRAPHRLALGRLAAPLSAPRVVVPESWTTP